MSDHWFVDYYVAPWCRYQSYGVGVIYGYILWKTNGKLSYHWVRLLTPPIAVISWFVIKPDISNWSQGNGSISSFELGVRECSSLSSRVWGLRFHQTPTPNQRTPILSCLYNYLSTELIFKYL